MFIVHSDELIERALSYIGQGSTMLPFKHNIGKSWFSLNS